MNHEVMSIVQKNPELLVFLALAAGYAFGKVRVRGFGLGTTASVLLAAMALGQIPIEVPSLLKNVSFALFAFCIGYQVGPQFFGSLRKDGLNYLWIALVVAVAGLATAITLGKVLHFDSGTTAGLFAGSMTQSAVIGTAQGAVANLSVPEAQKAMLDVNIAIAYAITYIFGTVGVILFFKLLPGLMRINLNEEARKLEEKMGGGAAKPAAPGLFSWSRAVGLRSFRLTRTETAGRTVGEIEQMFPVRVAVERIRRGGEPMEARPDTILKRDDILVMTGNYLGLVNAAGIIGEEVDADDVAEMIGESLDVCVLNTPGKTLAELARTPEVRGLYLRRITRQDQELPITADTVIHKCDVIHLVGAKERVEQAARRIGYALRPSVVTDLLIVGIGCFVGALVGMITIPVGGIPITLGMAGGVLLAGLVAGWLRSMHPTFGRIPGAAQWLLSDLGLNLFIACVGLSSGSQALAALQNSGLSIFLAGAVTVLASIVVGLFFGKYVLRMNPVLLLGALTGAKVLPPALTALQEETDSPMLSLSFAAPFAFANVLLTVLGSLIINLM